MTLACCTQVCAQAAPQSDTALPADGPIPVASPAVNVVAPEIRDPREQIKEIVDLYTEGEASLAKAPRPVFVVFENSPHLSEMVAADLERRGVKTTADAAAAPTKLELSGRVLMSGPFGRHTFDMGQVFEKVLANAPVAEQVKVTDAQRVGYATRDVALAAGWYKVGLFTPFLFDYFSVNALADALGVKGGMNRAIAGDSRGFCLSGCDNWKNTVHQILIFATVKSGGEVAKARAGIKAWLTQPNPQPPFDVAYTELLDRRLLAQ
jgi:hypothetical protein